MPDQSKGLTKDSLPCSTQKQKSEERANIFSTSQNTEASPSYI